MKLSLVYINFLRFIDLFNSVSLVGRFVGDLRKVNNLYRYIIIVLSFAGMPVFGANTAEKPQINWEPFEPPVSNFYNPENKYDHPPEIVAPRFLWPFEMRRSVIMGETIVLVKIDKTGRPIKILVFSSTDKLFTRSTIFALEKARWNPSISDVWFYYKVTFDPEKMLK